MAIQFVQTLGVGGGTGFVTDLGQQWTTLSVTSHTRTVLGNRLILAVVSTVPDLTASFSPHVTDTQGNTWFEGGAGALGGVQHSGFSGFTPSPYQVYLHLFDALVTRTMGFADQIQVRLEANLGGGGRT